jgi:uncharacterized membrane protein (UPF0127 family)
MKPVFRTIAIAFLLLAAGCRNEQPQSNLPTVKMQLGSEQFVLEIAADGESRERGLMRRDSMPDNHGMIFVFSNADVLKFWMKDTRIPLDIVYVGANGDVVAVKQMKPYDRSTTSSDAPAKWAIELNQGTAMRAGVKVGQSLQIPPEAQNSKD